MAVAISELVGLAGEASSEPDSSAKKLGSGLLAFYEEYSVVPALGDKVFLSGKPTEVVIFDRPFQEHPNS